jgi:hypothetical protein
LLETNKSEVAKLKEQITRTHQLYLDQSIDSAGFKERYTPQQERVRQLQEDAFRIQCGLDLCRINSLSTETVVSEALDLQKRWPNLETEEKRRVVESIVESIVVDKEAQEIEITLSCIPTFGETANSQQALALCWDFVTGVIRVNIPKVSVYRRLWKNVADAPKTLGEHLPRKRVDIGLTNVQVAQSLGVAYQTHSHRNVVSHANERNDKGSNSILVGDSSLGFHFFLALGYKIRLKSGAIMTRPPWTSGIWQGVCMRSVGLPLYGKRLRTSHSYGSTLNGNETVGRLNSTFQFQRRRAIQVSTFPLRTSAPRFFSPAAHFVRPG